MEICEEEIKENEVRKVEEIIRIRNVLNDKEIVKVVLNRIL